MNQYLFKKLSEEFILKGVGNMDIAVIGTGYVGLVVGTCLADLGNNVICVDIDRKKIAKLNRANGLITEPDLPKLLGKNEKLESPNFTPKVRKAVKISSELN